jgi:uncharacterized protein (DUF58 family)
MVHWRSSARVGHLVVRQQLAAATTGTAVVLDCDVSAYGSDERFGSGWIDDRFEAAVEIAASFVAADIGRNEQVTLLLSTRGSSAIIAPARSPAPCLDQLAVVQPAAPVNTDPDELPRAVRRARCARAIVVSGTPRAATVDAARRIQRSGTPTLLVRVGAGQTADVPGLRTVDIQAPSNLA